MQALFQRQSGDLNTYRNVSIVLFLIATFLVLSPANDSNDTNSSKNGRCPPCDTPVPQMKLDIGNEEAIKDIQSRWKQVKCDLRDVSLSTFKEVPPGFLAPTVPPVMIHVQDHATQAYLYYTVEEPIFTALRVLTEKAGNAEGLILDIGSGYGTFAIYAAKLGYPTIAVEPDSSLKDFILQSAETNEVTANKPKNFFQVKTFPIFAKNVKDAKSITDLIEAQNVPFLVNIVVPGFEALIIHDALNDLKNVQHIIISVAVQSPQLDAQKQKLDQLTQMQRLRDAGFALLLMPGPCDPFMTKVEKSAMKGFPFNVVALRDQDVVTEMYTVLRDRLPKGSRCIVWAIKQ